MDSLADLVEVVIGVDTHVDTHSAAAVHAGTGAVLAELTVAATPDGYQALVEFAEEHSDRRMWAVEGTGAHGAGLARHLTRADEVVVELDRPERAARRRGAKSDPLDAVRAAREALSRPRLGTPRAGGDRQALSVLLAARSSAVDGAGAAQRQLFSLVIAAPDCLRARFRGQTTRAMVTTAARLRLNQAWDPETATTATILRDLARRSQELTQEAARHHKAIAAIVVSWRPDLLDQQGVGPIVAAVILCAWSHPGRLHSDGAFAMLGGVAPIPATSGRTTNRHRLNPYGDRQLNRALHTIVLSRLRWDPTTQAYAKRRTAEGKTARDIKRCLKRYVARDIFRLLEHAPATT